MRPRTATLPVLVLALVSFVPVQKTSTVSQETGAKTWVGRYQEVEEYMRTAECLGVEVLGNSAKPLRRCALRPGGPLSRMAWRPQVEGVYQGFKESYKAEIAAYELDKLLQLDMVPPVVERELQGYKGSATFWVEDVVEATNVAANAPDRWQLQLTRAKMFDNIIGNRYRNRANVLLDKAWNAILIDHVRAFGSGTDLPHDLTRIDRALWARIEALTRKQLDTALGRWLDADEIEAILQRREKMKAIIAKRAG